MTSATPASPGFVYQGHMTTHITLEEPVAGNPYVTRERFTRGYRSDELVAHSSYVEVLYLLLRGELPEAPACALLEKLLVGLSNPGPRHPAVRAAMTAGLSKTNAEHLLPIGLLVGGGRAVVEAWQFAQTQRTQNPVECAARLWDRAADGPLEAPGFGSHFDQADPVLATLVAALMTTGDWPTLKWGADFAAALAPQGYGWLTPGLVACVGCDLQLNARQSIALFQLALAPAILAHGMEQMHRPITAGPLLEDKDYELLDP